MQQKLRWSQDHDHVGGSRVRRKSGRSSEVLREQIREVQELAKEARRNLPSGSSQVQEFAGSPQEDHRGFVG